MDIDSSLLSAPHSSSVRISVPDPGDENDESDDDDDESVMMIEVMMMRMVIMMKMEMK